MNNNIKVSVVIPVYNSEKYLSKCIKSIINQSLDFKNNIEILLINDGSIDDSERICLKYKDIYPENINYISQKNQGVSVARNNGIKNARGKYIMLLDSDDYISEKAIEELYDFFEKNYDEIDIITYPIKFLNKNIIEDDKRYQAYTKGTNIYDINKYYNLNQSTINIIFKNKKDTPLFDENMSLAEDQKFCTELIMKKEKIGFVETSYYYYRRENQGASSLINNPYYCFEDIMSYNESLIKKFKKDNKIPKYIQSLIIQTIKWRIGSDMLFPYYLEGEEYKKAIKRIKNIINYLDTKVILSIENMNLYHKIYLLEFSGRKIEYEYKDKKLLITCENNLVEELDKIKGIINRLKVKNDKLYFIGTIYNPIFKYKEPEVYLEMIDEKNTKKKIKLDSYISNESYFKSKIKTTTAYSFETNIDYKNIKSFKVYIKIDDNKMDINFNPNRYVSNNFIAKYKIVLYSKKDNQFKLRHKTIINLLKNKIRNFINSLKKNQKSVIYRILYYFYNPKKIWLYTDRGDAIDNAYFQFKHDILKDDNIKRYYISRFNNDQINNLFNEKEKKYMVKQNSLKHKLLFMHSDKILTSFSDLQVYCPFNKSIKIYNDLLKYDLIYLQHGILYAHLIRMYSKHFKQIDKFVISTTLEKKNLINIYQYKEEDLICSGMSRMNQPVEEQEEKTNNKVKKILFAPSWRANLIGPLVNNKRDINTINFLESKFYKEIIGFLQSKELNDYLEKNNLELDFKLHPIFKDYSKLFNFKNNPKIKLKEGKTNFNEYSIFITDFSSFQFDFVKINKPIIYFFPDLAEFKAGLHSYRELDLDLNNAYGKLCQTKEETIKEIKNIVNNNYKSEKKYINNSKNLFFEINNPCEDIYNSLIK